MLHGMCEVQHLTEQLLKENQKESIKCTNELVYFQCVCKHSLNFYSLKQFGTKMIEYESEMQYCLQSQRNLIHHKRKGLDNNHVEYTQEITPKLNKMITFMFH